MKTDTPETKLMAKTEEPKFFNQDLLQKLFLMIVGFLFTGIIGAFLSFYFQSKSAYNNNKTGLIQSERKTAKDIFEEVTTAMDSRAYYAQIVNDNNSLYPGKPVAIEKWNAYVTEMDAWNKNLNRRRKLVQLYFGKQIDKDVQNIHSKFLSLNLKLNVTRKGLDDDAYQKAKVDLTDINGKIGEVSYKMIHSIQTDSVGQIATLKKFSFFDSFFNR